MSQVLELTPYGAAGGVTGARFLLRAGDRRYLIDCGLFQGGQGLKARNWRPFPVPPHQIDAVLLTHAHLDHTGYLPRLVQQGFRGPVYASEATCALLEILLRDSAHLQEQDARYANRNGHKRRKPAQPLYTVADAEAALQTLQPVRIHKRLNLDGPSVVWRPSGHILGAAWLEVDAGSGDGKRTVVFSGDLGRYEQEVMKSPWPLQMADYLVVETTYGNRLHSHTKLVAALGELVQTIVEQGGVLLIPAFTVGRTQQVLFYLRTLQDQGVGGGLPIYVDSPMAVDATSLYCRFGDDHNLKASLLMDDRECPLRCRETHFVRDVEESKILTAMAGPAVILSASGMATGGRIVHHLKSRLPDRRNVVLFIGYQAQGTRGRYLLDGATRVTIHGQKIPVRARIASIDALSAHADRDELLRWMSDLENPRARRFWCTGSLRRARPFKNTSAASSGGAPWSRNRTKLTDLSECKSAEASRLVQMGLRLS